jgi:uncharacterized protein
MSALPYGPPPQPTAVSAPHWAAGEHGELRVQHCEQCRRFVFNPATTCPFCLSGELTWVRSSGLGVVHTMTTVYRAPTSGTETPYVVAVIELEEGWYMFSNIVDCAARDVAIDMPVVVTFRQLSDDVWLPVFRPAKRS